MARFLVLLTLFFGTLTRVTSQATDGQVQDNNNVPPIAPAEWATSYPLALTRQDAVTENLIRDTLAHYPLALDGKNFAALNRVFTTDAIANYSAPLGVLTPLSAIQETLKYGFLQRVAITSAEIANNSALYHPFHVEAFHSLV